MASGLPAGCVFALCVLLSPCVSGGEWCEGYYDGGTYHGFSGPCSKKYCCGSCYKRKCCDDFSNRLSPEDQSTCSALNFMRSELPLIAGIVIPIIFVLILIFCCCCSRCPLYKSCRKPKPVENSTTHSTVVPLPQQYPLQQVTTPGHPAGYQHPSYQITPIQPGYGAQPVPQSYGAEPTVPYQGQPFTPGPPLTYQESSGFSCQPTASQPNTASSTASCTATV
ncbi:protein shisa-5-like isoform X2 [Betta splendens]|uniref:Protein shisa-5-like isoform X2 n=1 Tax=Betta splendens TaxID=158456 RepID=A0A6P7MLL9_BETSP|nr:protein shisa-5-like isoform X2 [Betta splendens]